MASAPASRVEVKRWSARHTAGTIGCVASSITIWRAQDGAKPRSRLAELPHDGADWPCRSSKVGHRYRPRVEASAIQGFAQADVLEWGARFTAWREHYRDGLWSQFSARPFGLCQLHDVLRRL